MAKRAALYLRVSTAEQDTENQRLALEQVASHRGWEIVVVYSDSGISGTKSRAARPGLNRMLEDASRRRFDVVMAWSIDRLGRSLVDLLGTIQHLEVTGVDVYLDQQAIDTTTPSGKLLFQITGAFSEFEHAMIRERVLAGLERARRQGKRLGRPKVPPEIEGAVRVARADGKGIRKIARELGVGNGTVERILREAAQA